ncbi:MAG TPA: hypothetical protein VNZ58_07460, partial [Thermomicrobiales bacterium]|nr:hypothetical protein [Thermomicrobiales bacterium]
RHRRANGSNTGGRGGGAIGTLLGIASLVLARVGVDPGDRLCRDRWRADMITARIESEKRIRELTGGEV